MFGFAFALAPLYDAFCEWTGLNGRTAAARPSREANPAGLRRSRSHVQFLAQVGHGLPWEFRPTKSAVARARRGARRRRSFYVRNRARTALIGQAVPSIAPSAAAPHLNKLECFCFLAATAGRAVPKSKWPVRFYVSTDLPQQVRTLTLSYTLFRVQQAGEHSRREHGAGRERSAALLRTAQKRVADHRLRRGVHGGVRRGDGDPAEHRESRGPGPLGAIVFYAGLGVLAFMMFGWFGTVIKESLQGLVSRQLDRSYRLGMLWFIVSEVMFFAAFFGALFYARMVSVPWLAGAGNKLETHLLLWPDFADTWPLFMTPGGTATQAMEAWGLPFINTVILVSSSATITFAHWALKKNQRTR